MTLTKPFHTKHDTAPFSSIATEDYVPAFKASIALARAEIDSIVNHPEPPTFENTIAALSYAGATLDRVSNIFFNLHSAHTNDRMQEIAQEVSPLLSEFGNDVRLNEKLFARVKTVWEQRHSIDLTPEQTTLLDKNYKSFSRNGANLPEDKKQQLREIDKELSALSLAFGENVLKETNAYSLHLTNPDDVSGLPEGALEAAAELARSQQKEGWIFTLDYPSYMPFMTYADKRDLRKKLALAYGARGFGNNEFDNRQKVLRIAALRQQRAKLLGYENHAHFVLEERMAQTPEKVNSFLSDLLEKSTAAAQREFEELSDFAKELHGIGQLEKWDGAYYSEKLRQQKYALDEEMLKPYFVLDNVLQGAFAVAGRLFGLRFAEVNDIDKYHPEVSTYEVFDDTGRFVAVFYTDFFPRKGKRNGAWMTSFKSQFMKNGQNERPHISIVCNFTRPTASKPSLLTFNEVTTLFHEFGHALHGILADTVYPSLSGTSVYWDFVELPSQIMENWCYEPQALALFAKHFQSGEQIPDEMVAKIRESATFQQGMATLRQLGFGLLDMGWHTANPEEITDVKAFEQTVMAQAQFYPDVAENAMSTAFSHIFQGGYAAGYYSYKWAEVLDADAFEHFTEHGIFNGEVATKFKEHILSKGGTEHPMTLYKRFRGQEPKPEALLKRAGLL